MKTLKNLTLIVERSLNFGRRALAPARRSAPVLGAGALLMCASLANAANLSWSGGASTDFEATGNWNGGTAPANDLTTDLGVFTGAVSANQPQITTSRSIKGLVFSTATGGWTLGSSSATNVLTIGAGGILTGTNATFTTGQTSGTNTISANIGLGAAQNWAAGTGGTLVVSGNITGSSALTIGLSPGNTGWVVLTGSNSNSGGITLRSSNGGGPGKLGIGSSNAITSGTLTLADIGGGTANLDAYNGNQTIGSGVSLFFAAGTDNFVGTNNLTFNGNAGMASNFGVKALTVSGGRLTLAGNVAFSSYIAKNGNGTLVLSGSNSGNGSAGTSAAGAVATAFSGLNISVAETAGTVELNNAYALSNGYIQMNGGMVTAGTALTGANKVVGGVVLNNTITAAIGGSNALEFGGALVSGSGNNTLTINNTGGTTFSGDFLLQESGATAGRALTLSGAGPVTITGTVANGGASGNSSLTYAGTGSLTLNAPNTYSGGTTLSSTGTLSIGNDSALGSGALNISGNGVVLASGGAHSIANNVTLTASPTITGANSLTLNGSVTNSGGNRQLNTTLTTGTLTLASNVNLSESTSTSRTLSIGSSTAGAAGTTTLISGVIQDYSGGVGSAASNLIVNGGGTVILAGNNTYTGTTTVNDANTLLQVGNAGTSGNLGAGAVTLNSGTLAFNRSDSLTVSGNISGAGSVNQAGSGTTILSGAASYTGATVINSGTLQVGNGTTGSFTGSGTVTDNGALVFNSGAASTVSGIISGNGSLTKAGSGQLTLSGSNTFSGASTLNSGTLVVGVNSTFSGGAVTSGALGTGALAINGGAIGGNGTILGNSISAAGDFAVTSAGTLKIGGTAVDLGGGLRTVTLLRNNAVTNASFASNLEFQNNVNSANPVTIQSGTLRVVGDSSLSGVAVFTTWNSGVGFANNAGLTLGNNVMAMPGGNNQLGNSASTYASLTMEAGSYLNLGNILNNSTSQSANLLSGTGIITNLSPNVGTGTLTVNGNTGVGATTFAGQIVDGSALQSTFSGATRQGIVALTIAGNTNLTLSGSNTYSGPTSIAGGKLIVSGALTASAVTVTSNSTLGGAGTIAQGVNVSVGTLAPGNLDGSGNSLMGTLNTGNLTLGGGVAHLSIKLGQTTAGIGASDQVNVTGSVALGTSDLLLSAITGYAPAPNDIFYLLINDGTDAVTGSFASLNGVSTTLSEGSTFTFSGQQYQITYQANYEGSSFTGGNDIAIQAVPEPSTWVTLLGGLGILASWRKRRRY